MTLSLVKAGFQRFLSQSSKRTISAKHYKMIRQIRAEYKRYEQTTDIDLETVFHQLSDEDRDEKSEEFSEKTTCKLFALVMLAATRAVGMTPYDVQIAAGLAMIEKNIVEMATGEGKTLVATLPASYFALLKKGVHVMTVNAYLAKRDCELMKPVYALLGLSVGYVSHDMDDAFKKQAYKCDITYGVGTDFGFDYLKDQLKLQRMPKLHLGHGFQSKMKGLALTKPDVVQRKHAYTIVDEADSVMLDEASSSLILSTGSDQAHPFPEVYQKANEVAQNLVEGVHFEIDTKKSGVTLFNVQTEDWELALSRELRMLLVRPWQMYVLQALKAHKAIHIDDAYIIEQDKIEIVDEYTGRRFSDRKWSEGMHQAVEAKEGLTITQESQSMLKIPRQQFFALYEGVCGMTGTALGCEQEFKVIFNLGIVGIPPNKKNRRELFETQFFATEKEKNAAIVKTVEKVCRKGNPILIGTKTIHSTEKLKQLINDSMVDEKTTIQLLNAKNDQEEAELVSKAGMENTVTIATNMAGRGTDIPLSQNAYEAGGLFVIVSEPHLSNRVDRQLIGRSARQGDPGFAMSFMSAEDELFEHNSALQKKIRDSAGKQESFPELEKSRLALQFSLDQKAFESRYKLFKYNEWINGLLEKIS